MSECEFYANYERTDESREVNASQQGRESKKHSFPCCSNPKAKYETFYINTIGGIVGGSTLLRCNGDLDRCDLNKSNPQK